MSEDKVGKLAEQVNQSSVKRLPEGAAWDIAKAEKNWCVAAETTTTKVPVNAATGFPCDREQAAFLDRAKAAQKANDLNKWIDEINAKIDRANEDRAVPFDHVVRFGVGYLPRARSAMVVADFDKVRDPDTGDITAEWLKPVMEQPESYTEVSASGTGLHVLMPREEADAGTRERNGAGLYASNARFILLTFDQVAGAPISLNSAPETRRVIRDRVGVQHTQRVNFSLALPEDHHSIESIPEILAQLPNPALGREYWVSMAHACWAAAQEADRATALRIEQAFYEWSARGDTHGIGRKDGSSPERLWRSIRNVREIGVGSFFYKAREMGWSPRHSKMHPKDIPHPRIEMVGLMDRAFDGDREALQRIARFMLNGNRDDTAFVMLTAMGHFSGTDVREIFQYESRRATRIAADIMREVMRNGG